MIEALELKATSEQLIDFYNKEVDSSIKGKNTGINFRNYVKYGWIQKKIK